MNEGRYAHEHHPGPEHDRMRPDHLVAVAVDPVCGMDVDPAAAAGASVQDEGQTYWFCSPQCRERFVANPERYHPAKSAAPIRPVSVPSESAADHRIFTCPMHPEVRRQGPGFCPKCGMALEPEAPS